MTTTRTLHLIKGGPWVQSAADTFDPATVSWVLDRDDLSHLLEKIRSTGEIVYDLETTGLDEHAVTHGQSNGGVAARIALASFTLPESAEDQDPATFLVPLSHPESPWLGRWRAVATHIAKAMRDSSGVLVGHNIKYDHRWMFAHTGVDLSHRPLWDTRISSHLLDENESTKLKERAPDTFGVPRWDDVELTTPGAAEREPLFKLGTYAARDTYWTWKLCRAHKGRMFPHPSEELFGDEVEDARLGDLAQYVAMPTTATLTSIEQRGLGLDTEWVQERIAEEEKLRDESYADLVSRYVGEGLDGVPPSFAPTSKWFRTWSEKAVENGDLRVAALTPSGKPQWSKQVLGRQARSGHVVAERLLEYRGAVKRLEYLRSWLGKVSTRGTIHATYNAGSVLTGRLSSSEPNMQQVTRALKPAFTPSPGYYLAELDYSQIELRVAAFISRCVPMINAFKDDMDLHLMISGRTNSDKAIQAASLYLVHLGLPPNRTGAEVLRRLRRGQGVGGVRTEVATFLRETHRAGAGEESGSRERWCAERGVESPVEGRDQPGAVSEVPEALVREVRGYCERFGWPWEWDADDAGRAPREPRQGGQPTLELDDAVQVVSSASAPILSELTGEDWAKIRQQGKAQNFGLIYGMGATGFRDYAEDTYGVHFTEQEAAKVHAAFFEMWGGIRDWHGRTVVRAHETGQVISPIGRVRRVPDVWDGNDKIAGAAERQAINSPVQGFASDIMQIAAACIEGTMVGVDPVPEARLVATVHDSILVEVPVDDWEAVTARCKEVMETDVPLVLENLGCQFDVPLIADADVGSRWGLTDVGTV